jgi:hypothetical protein
MAFTNIRKRPKDLDKFTTPAKAAELLGKVLEALQTADQTKKVHMRLTIRVWSD